LPEWTLLVSLLGFAISLMIVLACRDFGLSWWIGGPGALAVALACVFLDRAVERKYAAPQRANVGKIQPKPA
jgi:hypothetical protein